MRIFLSFILVLFAGCAPQAHYSEANYFGFMPEGLHNKNNYEIDFRDPSRGMFISEKWRITNWSYSPSSKHMTRCQTALCKGKIYSDFNRDGKLEIEETFFLDLELRHARTDGLIWVDSRAVAIHERETALNVYLEEYVNRLTGADFWNAENYFGRGVPKKTQTYAATVIEKEALTFGPYPAVLATISLADINQLKLNPDQRYGTIKLLIVRIDGDFSHHFSDGAFFKSNKGLLTVGYFSINEYYEDTLPDFYAFLNQFSFPGGSVSPIMAPSPKRISEQSTPAEDTDTHDSEKETD